MNKGFKIIHRSVTASYQLPTILPKCVLFEDSRITINGIGKVNWFLHSTGILGIYKLRTCIQVLVLWFRHLRVLQSATIANYKFFPTETHRKSFVLSDFLCMQNTWNLDQTKGRSCLEGQFV